MGDETKRAAQSERSSLSDGEGPLRHACTVFLMRPADMADRQVHKIAQFYTTRPSVAQETKRAAPEHTEIKKTVSPRRPFGYLARFERVGPLCCHRPSSASCSATAQ